MPFENKATLHTTSDTWVGAGTTSASTSPTIQTLDLSTSESAVISAVIDITTPAAGTFTAANATEIFTLTSHGFVTGLKVQVSNSGGGLPTGLSTSTDYFVIKINANTFYLATTLANAIAGTNLLISGDGTGTNTVTPTTFAGGSLKLQASIDEGTTWIDVPGETRVVTADATEVFEIDYVRYPMVRLYPTCTAGYLTVNAKALTKK
jgi:hypothetical protein